MGLGQGGEGGPGSAVGPVGVLGFGIPDPGGDGLGSVMVGLRKFRGIVELLDGGRIGGHKGPG